MIASDRRALIASLDKTFEDAAYDDITRLAAEVCGVPSALISLVDQDELLFKARVNFAAERAPRDASFCDSAIAHDAAFVVEDAMQDPRFRQHINVVGEPRIRFYAGVPIDVDGWTVGLLCAIGYEPKNLASEKLMELEFLAQQVMQTVSARRRAGT